eukprot:UN10618
MKTSVFPKNIKHCETLAVYSLPIWRYKWKVTDLSQIQNIAVVGSILSDVISINSLKFVLQISVIRNGKISVKLKFIYPLFIDKIKFGFIKLEFEEANAVGIYSLLSELKTDLNINKLQHLKQLTINLDLMITAVYKNGDIISNWKDYFVETKTNFFFQFRIFLRFAGLDNHEKYFS